MGATALIGIGLGVATTSASIASQNRQVAAQNRAISNQISANQDSERIRRMSSAVQQQLIKDTSKAESIARQTSFIEQRNQLRQAARQSRNEQARQVDQLQQQQEQNRIQADSAIAQISADRRAVEQGLDERTIDTLRSLSQALSQIPDPTPELENLSRQVDDITANAIATTGVGGRTNQNLRGPNRELVAQTLSAIASGQQVSAAALQELAETEEYNQIVSDIAQLEAGLQVANVGNQLRATEDNTNLAIQRARTQGRAFRSQVGSARQQLRTNRQIANTQADLNRQIALGSLRSGVALDAAQSAQQRAQLAGQSVQGTSGFVNALSIASQFTPLLQFTGSGSTTQQPQQQFITQPPPTGVGGALNVGSRNLVNLLQR